MARFVIDPGATLELASAAVDVPPDRELYAPTLWRSETLSAMYEAVRRGDITEDDARRRLAYVNGLKIRLLGDAVLRRRAWELAQVFGPGNDIPRRVRGARAAAEMHAGEYRPDVPAARRRSRADGAARRADVEPAHRERRGKPRAAARALPPRPRMPASPEAKPPPSRSPSIEGGKTAFRGSPRSLSAAAEP